jgi:hypothetical protein
VSQPHKIHIAAIGAWQTLCREPRAHTITNDWLQATCRRCLVMRSRLEQVVALRRGLEVAKEHVLPPFDPPFWARAEEAIEAEAQRILRGEP